MVPLPIVAALGGLDPVTNAQGVAGASNDAPQGRSGSSAAPTDGQPGAAASDGQGHPNDTPSISLPKGGGAIRGLGEKFAVNTSTGTGSLSVPLPISPGRDGVQPGLALSYDSGAGNGPFGIGWTLGGGAITCKTDKGLPRRIPSGPEADVYVFNGAEDLVPVLDPGVGWTHAAPTRTLPDHSTWIVELFRPRLERLHSRIERWTPVGGGPPHWRQISKDGVTSLYGTSDESRIRDPADPAGVFSWLLVETYDQKGNAMLFRYVAEDSTGVDVGTAHERNRTPVGRATNRYVKRILYGNTTPRTDGEDLTARTDWLFELVLDYGEHDATDPKPADAGAWPARPDPFSTYRPRFEVRTYRLCRRLLMFHHFPNERGVGADCLVRSLTLGYDENPIATKLVSLTQSGHRRDGNGFVTRSFPAVELTYTEPQLDIDVHEVDAENLPQGIGGAYRLIDLDGEGLPGILTEQAGGWHYKRNVSPLTLASKAGSGWTASFAALESEPGRPSLGALASGREQLMDLDGDGRLELALLDPPVSGFHSRAEDGTWESFEAFASMPQIAWASPDLRFGDLTGDGLADALLAQDGDLLWHPSMAKLGFGERVHAPQPFDEEQGPRLVFADGTQSVYLADLSGDGLADLVRIRNGDVCYWPSLGYGAFGAKVAMDNAPLFDTDEKFDQRRVRIADVDGSGPSDLVYITADGVRLFANQCGNAFSDEQVVDLLPDLGDPSGVTVTDLLGNGTSCLVWSSALPGNAQSPLRYVDLMGGTKPHLLVGMANNLGAETVVGYTSSTKFYVQDRAARRPWITRLAFPVQVVERVETYDRISHNRFVTRYAYHHGHFDAAEREFRGFACVDQIDTEEYAALSADGTLPAANVDLASHVPPVRTTTWFHTGAHLGGARISKQLEREYYREGDTSDGLAGLTDGQTAAMELADTVLPTSILLPDGTRQAHALTPGEEREACRALKGSILRQEVYGLDGTDAQDRPYSVSERKYAVELLSPRGANQHAVFMTYGSEIVELQYERALYDHGGAKVADPRIAHMITFTVDPWGNVLRSAAIAYGRRYAAPGLSANDAAEQRRSFVTYSQFAFTNAVDTPDACRAPAISDAASYELVNVMPAASVAGVTNLFRPDELDALIAGAADGAHDLEPQDVDAAGATQDAPYRRLLNRSRTLYRSDDLAAPLALGVIEPRGLPHCSYRLVFTQSLLDDTYMRGGTEALVADPHALLGGEGGYVSGGDLSASGAFPATDPPATWWAPASRTFFSPGAADSAATELAHATAHFFAPARAVDPFGQAMTVTRDVYDLLLAETEDALGNRTTSGTRTAHGIANGNDYRVLQPGLVTDPNGNRSAVAFDAQGMVVGTAVMGPDGTTIGDSLAGFAADLAETEIVAQVEDPLADPHAILGTATGRYVYDLNAYTRTKADAQPQPAAAYTLTRETHESDLAPHALTACQPAIAYSDGFGRELQRTALAEPGPLIDGRPDVTPRWTRSGHTVYNNKGKAVRSFEPSFSATPAFEDVLTGVSSIAFYDPIVRVAGELRADHTFVKTVTDPWLQAHWDANDTVSQDPATDLDLGGYVALLPSTDYSPTWRDQRIGGGLGAAEQAAATKAVKHAGTPGLSHFDAMQRPFLTIAHNRFASGGTDVEEHYETRTRADVEGHQRSVIDARGRVIVQSAYDLLGRRTRYASMEQGTHWVLADVNGSPIRQWDSRGHTIELTHDELRRPSEMRLLDGHTSLLAERTTYGESQPNPEASNLRGKAYRIQDGAGVITNVAYDFKSNLVQSERRLAVEYKQTLDWSSAVPLEAGSYTSSSAFDALNRPITIAVPDGSVLHPAYNVGGLLEAIAADLGGTATQIVSNVDYNARGQRTLIEYGNGARTAFAYDPDTFRVTSIVTTRGAAFPGDVQHLTCTYDPVGNLTQVRDDAQQRIFFDNTLVDATSDSTFDAVYRLIEATGREHLGQSLPVPTSDTDAPRVGLPQPGDGNAMGRYTEAFTYDEVGNLLTMAHRGTAPVAPGWGRTYAYAEASLLEPAKHSNRLSSTTDGGSPAVDYGYDEHGNMRLPHLTVQEWDFHDRLHATSRQVVNSGTPETTYYVYDSGGQRVRKVTERQAKAGITPTRKSERAYLGAFEVYREYAGDGATVTLKRNTVCVKAGGERVALVERRTQGDDGTPAQLVRYQLGNAAGSAALELDQTGAVITYEEYYPYGGTSYLAARAQTEAPKRYRYSGQERDEESGLGYFGARYLAPWLGRWLSCDPSSIEGGVNLYAFAACNPVVFKDRTGHQPDPVNTANTIDDLLTFLHAQSGFEAGSQLPPTFSSASASPFGTRAHSLATDVLQEMKDLGFGEADRIYSEVRVVNGTITQIGGTPGGPAGSHNIDVLVSKPGQSFNVGDNIGGGAAERIGDLKYGGGRINTKYGVHGSPLETVTGRTSSAASDPALLTSTAEDTSVASDVSTLDEAGTAVADSSKLEEGVSVLADVTKADETLNTVSQVAKVEETVATVAKGAEATSFLAKAAPIVAVVAKPLAVIGKVAGPLGLIAGAAQFATAKNTEQRVDAGITVVASGLMMSKHPVAIAAGAGLMTGQVIDKTLDVSDKTSSAGVWTYEHLKDAGVNDTAAFVTGGVVSVVAIPTAITIGAAEKVGEGASWLYHKIF